LLRRAKRPLNKLFNNKNINKLYIKNLGTAWQRIEVLHSL
jgi:hypothetical protein